MSLKLYFHPLASYCWKALIALYENETPFERRLIDLSDAASRAELESLWPFAKFPVLRDEARDQTVPESTIVIEYLAQHYPGRVQLVPADLDLACETRQWDRFFDLYVHEPMQKVVGDRIRPPGTSDAYGVDQAKRVLRTAYGVIDRRMKARAWAMGDAFTMADCAAAPALYYANRVEPLGDSHAAAAAYLARLSKRPSFARVFEEAQPYFHLFPG
jgi:glutathione S-transferase